MPGHLIHPNRQSRLDIELDLMPTDRIFQRWARSVGNDLPVSDAGADRSQATPLPDDAAIVVDQYICGRAQTPRQFLHAWYRGQDSSADIAQRFGLTRDAVYMYWRAVLWAARATFLSTPCIAHLMQKHLEALQAAA